MRTNFGRNSNNEPMGAGETKTIRGPREVRGHRMSVSMAMPAGRAADCPRARGARSGRIYVTDFGGFGGVPWLG